MNTDYQMFLQAIEALRDELKTDPLEPELVRLENTLQNDEDVPQFITQAITIIREHSNARKRLKELTDDWTSLKVDIQLPGKRYAPIKVGPVMVCSKDSSHPRRKLHRTGQTCRICGAELIQE